MVTIPLATRTARAIDLVIGERADGPVFLAADGRRLDRHGAGRIVRKTARRAGIGKAVTPHTLRHAFITAVSTPESRCATSKKPRHMLTREPRCGMTGPAAASTGTLPTSSLLMSRALPGSGHRLEQLRPAVSAAGQSFCCRRSVLLGDAPRSQGEREPIWMSPGPCTRTIHPTPNWCSARPCRTRWWRIWQTSAGELVPLPQGGPLIKKSLLPGGLTSSNHSRSAHYPCVQLN